MSEIQGVKTEQFEFAEESVTYPQLLYLHQEGNRMIAEEQMSDRRRLAIGRVITHIGFEIVQREVELRKANHLDELPVQEQANA